MGGIETYLNFTVESGEEFERGWLPMLDVSLKVGEQNRIIWKFFEKETYSGRTVQKRVAMEENSKLKIVLNDLVRGLCNSMEDMGEEERRSVINGYGEKLLNSGYNLEQTRSILVNGMKGYEGKRKRCSLEEGL